MQAQAAESSGYAEEPPPLFELRRVHKAGKGSRHSVVLGNAWGVDGADRGAARNLNVNRDQRSKSENENDDEDEED
jgi:hypothetical protein